jgi:hypothetical protein
MTNRFKYYSLSYHYSKFDIIQIGKYNPEKKDERATIFDVDNSPMKKNIVGSNKRIITLATRLFKL